MTTTYYAEKYRPQFHFSPEKQWMNDPNGMVYFNGEYHLFYQYHPFSTVWGPMHWGHAVSKDMIHWEHLPIGLYPDEHGAIFSGSAVVDWNDTSGFFDGEAGLVAIYTSGGNYPDSDRPLQRQSIAYSKDNGRTWITYAGNPVLADESKTDYRDPKVFWHKETAQWIMVLATGDTITIYTSPNLKEWAFASEFGKEEGSHEGVWECPDLFKLPVNGDSSHEKWVMIVSIGDNPEYKEGSRTQYFIGQFDGKTFHNENDKETVLWLDYGMDNYAGVSWSDIAAEDGRRIYIGWMSNWRYANIVPTEEWRSAMTLPRVLSLGYVDNQVRVIQQPVAELDAIRKDKRIYENVTLEADSAAAYELNNGTVEIALELQQVNATQLEIVIQHSDAEYTAVRYSFADNKLAVDRTRSGEADFSEFFPVVQQAPLALVDNRLKLQMFIDNSSIELFANDGEVAITSLIFPGQIGNSLTLRSSEGTVNITELKISGLASIWNK